MKARLSQKIFFIVLFLSIILLAFFITKPFLPALLTGAIFAYLAYPLYVKIHKHVKKKQIASFLTTILLVLLFTVPFILIVGIIFNQANNTYLSIRGGQSSLSEQNLGENFVNVVCKSEEWVSCRATRFALSFLPKGDLDYYINATIQKITSFIISNITKFISSLPFIFLNLFVMTFVIYYLLIDGHAVVNRLRNIIPLK